ncbi:hypothetical protein BHF71_07060 [Vulcanibacillus modesticaldus]|uniref:[Fe-S]-binding protein n=1 Tax=Vulcanibacillus modesticaldus TaxID=337097 RepID=A0A1D2YW72_9BACI|nr:DUF1284 domain-containing protein [Vulcanibacillus modesticaldus]OEF99949.1 hypothetical protein BHF71_07060 [Vulcanibacillus modesticaldus]
MDITLRGHHLLCIHGFQGMGYNHDFIINMEDIVGKIRDSGNDFDIQVLIGLDNICKACPHQGGSQCIKDDNSDQHVKLLDSRVIQHLQLKENNRYSKFEILKKTKELVKPDDLDFLCEGCSWLPSGICKNGIMNLKNEN